MKLLCFIPARGGSKSIKLKNIKQINKKPLIHYTIINSLKAKIFDYVIVSTDNSKIKKACKKFITNKDFFVYDRNKSISHDKSLTEEALMDVLKKIFVKKKYKPDWIFILEPTSPLRSVKSILIAKSLIKKNGERNSIISIKKIDHTPGYLKNDRFIYSKKRVIRRQDRIQLYEESSTIYCVKYNYFKKANKIVEKKPLAFKIPKIETIDINDNDDFQIASIIAKNK